MDNRLLVADYRIKVYADHDIDDATVDRLIEAIDGIDFSDIIKSRLEQGDAELFTVEVEQ